MVTSPDEPFGDGADGAARLEGVPVALLGQHRHGDRVLALLVPALGQPPRIPRVGVDVVEVLVGQSVHQRITASPTANSRSSTNGGNTTSMPSS